VTFVPLSTIPRTVSGRGMGDPARCNLLIWYRDGLMRTSRANPSGV
jgi:hypothetical protein